MKILIFHQFYTSPSEPGIGRFYLFGIRWQALGHKIRVIAGEVNYLSGRRREGGGRSFWFWRTGDEAGISVTRVWSSRLGFGYHSFLGRALTYITFLKAAFFAALFSGKPNAVIASSPPFFLGIIAYFTARIKGAKFIFEVRDLWPDELIELGGLKNKLLIRICFELEKFLYGKADRIIVNSPGLKRFLIREKGTSEDKIGVVENPAEFRAEKEEERGAAVFKTAEREALEKGDFIVFYGGNHGRVYDFDILLEAAKEFDGEGRRIFFVLMGGGKKRAEAEKRVRSEIIKNVILMDPVGRDKFGAYVKAASVCAVPLRDLRLLKNIYATKVIEFMAFGKPIVLLMEGVSGELVREAECGFVLRPGDREGMKNALIYLMDNPAEARSMGEKGLRYARLHFSADFLAEKYLREVEKLEKSDTNDTNGANKRE